MLHRREAMLKLGSLGLGGLGLGTLLSSPVAARGRTPSSGRAR